ncbi:hypothetical protein P3S67_031710 [Capsicum chacoense]
MRVCWADTGYEWVLPGLLGYGCQSAPMGFWASALSSLPKYPELISAHTILRRRQRHLYIGLRRNPVSILIFDSLGEVSTSSQTVNTVDDIFDSALNIEDTHYKEGYLEGYTDGLNSVKDEDNPGRAQNGVRSRRRIRFYRGCIEVWNAAILVEPTCFSSRVQKSIKQMDELLRKYPFSDPENESAIDTIDSLRLKFRTICATLNIKLEYDGYRKASGINKTGF